MSDQQNTCEKCRWWEQRGVQGLNDRGVCGQWRTEHPKARGQNGGAIRTDADFGCNQWEPKESDD